MDIFAEAGEFDRNLTRIAELEPNQVHVNMDVLVPAFQGHTNAELEREGMRNARPLYSRPRSVLAFLLHPGIASARRPLAAGTSRRDRVTNNRVELHPLPP
jgi:hypothetical protein